MIFKGVGVAIVTPFKKNKEVDYSALKKLVKHQIDGGTDYIVVQGTTGENATLKKNEKRKILDVVIAENNGKLPIVYGVGGNNTKLIADEMSNFDVNGVDGFLSVSPYYNKPTQKGIYEHFKMLSKASKLPIILYNVPGRTSSNVLPETIIKLAKDCKNIVAVKEASGDITQIMKLIKDAPSDFLIISGDDQIAMPIILSGGHGVISVVSNAYPKVVAKMVSNAIEGNISKAKKFHYEMYDIIPKLFEEGNPGGIKEACVSIGLMKNYLRLPLVNISKTLKSEILELGKVLS